MKKKIEIKFSLNPEHKQVLLDTANIYDGEDYKMYVIPHVYIETAENEFDILLPSDLKGELRERYNDLMWDSGVCIIRGQ